MGLFFSVPSPSQASEPFIAQIIMFGGNFAPRNWAFCDGQILPISQNTALFSLLGTTYGGDGRTSFGLPDLRGRTAVHPGTGPGLSSRRLGERWGAEQVILSLAQMPSHNHNLNATSNPGNTTTPAANTVLARDGRDRAYSTEAPNVDMTGGTDNTGGSQPFNISQPSLGIYHIIALQGVYPSRS
ncbi:phage tail protein [Desulfogranum mediterraneum]|uniref:phage tail protein n=1 Tax=Desulfogranum mediterraneum TaxID=160661 RepID=UPI00068649A3